MAERDKKDAGERDPREDQADEGGFGKDTIYEPVPQPTPGGETPREEGDGTRETRRRDEKAAP
jgi:hypothetical protein